jgi:hypothetical protein
MANVYPSETLRETAAMNKLRIATVIADLSRSIAFLSADIELEEARVSVHDVSHPTYPVLARSLRTRRANIEATVASLEQMVHGGTKKAA